MNSTIGFVQAERQFHDQAISETGLDDFGSDNYLPGLRALANAYDTEAQFGEIGISHTRAMIVNCLKGRLYTLEGLRRCPDCVEQVIEKPIFIIGLPRTGTTTLHRLLAQLSGNQGLEYWLGCYPMPRPPCNQWPYNPRYQEVVESLQLLRKLSPDMRAIHEMTPEGIDECRLLLMHSFANVTFQANATIPSYEQWLYKADMQGAYDQYASALKLISSTSPGRRWVLKDSSHLWAIESLLKVFPDACIIQTHRDPVEVIASVSSLVYSARKMNEPGISPATVGQQQLEQWSLVLEKAMSARQRNPERFYDVYYENFVADPITAVDQIYSHFGMQLDFESADRLRHWMSSHPQGRHGTHHYKPEDFGLSKDKIRDFYREYQSFFFS
jgi:hypothetical protein